MVNLEKNGSIKSNLNYKRKIQPSLYLTFLMGIKSFLKVMPFVSTFAKANRKDLLGRNADEQVALYTALGVLKDMHPKYIQYVYRTYG